MEYVSQPKGICPKNMQFEISGGIVSNIRFTGGCAGNLSGIGLLAEGRDALEVAKTLAKVTCGAKKTSCPMELSKAIMKALKQEKKPRTPPEKPSLPPPPKAEAGSGARKTGAKTSAGRPKAGTAAANAADLKPSAVIVSKKTPRKPSPAAKTS
ncbi:MAG: TIGR03905 family TSCPD domain-containing protein [Deltaproteobacteria bacterium]|jgi:uncharacterized protein (TIGR03905 family)|nr:TIGR03905 family TSCPD domain-containing protein [Deltaproteobacteria bacterium]